MLTLNRSAALVGDKNKAGLYIQTHRLNFIPLCLLATQKNTFNPREKQGYCSYFNK